MTLTEQVYTQARLMDPQLQEENQALLEALCAAAVAQWKTRLRENVGPEDCLSDFVTASAMYALAAMSGIGSMAQLEQIKAGDVLLQKGENTAARGLRYQADMLMRPYSNEAFLFAGV